MANGIKVYIEDGVYREHCGGHNYSRGMKVYCVDCCHYMTYDESWKVWECERCQLSIEDETIKFWVSEAEEEESYEDD